MVIGCQFGIVQFAILRLTKEAHFYTHLTSGKGKAFPLHYEVLTPKL